MHDPHTQRKRAWGLPGPPARLLCVFLLLLSLSFGLVGLASLSAEAGYMKPRLIGAGLRHRLAGVGGASALNVTCPGNPIVDFTSHLPLGTFTETDLIASAEDDFLWAAENYTANTASVITQVTVWGLVYPYGIASDGILDDLRVVFYPNTGGIPSSPAVFDETLSFTQVPTGIEFFGLDVCRFTIPLLSDVTQTSGWVRVSSSDPGDLFVWAMSATGDDTFYLSELGVGAPHAGNLSLCLEGKHILYTAAWSGGDVDLWADYPAGGGPCQLAESGGTLLLTQLVPTYGYIAIRPLAVPQTWEGHTVEVTCTLTAPITFRFEAIWIEGAPTFSGVAMTQTSGPSGGYGSGTYVWTNTLTIYPLDTWPMYGFGLGVVPFTVSDTVVLHSYQVVAY